MNLIEALKWYADLYEKPGWSDYVRQRVRELAREFPEVFGELPDRMTAEMRRRKLSDSSHPSP